MLGFGKEETDVEGRHVGLGPAFLPALVQSELRQQDAEHTLHVGNPLTSGTTWINPPSFRYKPP